MIAIVKERDDGDLNQGGVDKGREVDGSQAFQREESRLPPGCCSSD